MELELNWLSKESKILLNPTFSKETAELAKRLLPLEGEFANHLWFATSGSTAIKGFVKYVALSKEAFLASAAAVNRHLEIDCRDVWINPLPLFHVGGLAIHARAFLNRAQVISYAGKWNPHAFCSLVNQHHGTVSSLVPTQVYDLVCANLTSPPSLKKVIVGGGSLSAQLYARAQALGWKLLPSYGMTETSSQIATAITSLPKMRILSHLEVRSDSENYLFVKGPSLLTCYGFLTTKGLSLENPKVNGWLKTEDKGSIKGNILTLFGREAHFVKISGENVNLNYLESILEEIKLKLKMVEDIVLVALEDPRLGYAVHLAVAAMDTAKLELLISEFQAAVLPFERIRRVHFLPELPRSPLNKLLRNELREFLEKNCISS